MASPSFFGDLKWIYSIGKVISRMKRDADDGISVYHRFVQNVEKFPERVGIVSEEESYTYADIFHASSQVTQWILQQGDHWSRNAHHATGGSASETTSNGSAVVDHNNDDDDADRCGTTVAVLMPNEPAFAWLWFALVRLGVTSSLLNHHLKHEALMHCIKVSHAKALILSSGNFCFFTIFKGVGIHLPYLAGFDVSIKIG